MRVAFDIDGCLDADPSAFQSLMASLRAAGHVVVVLTGCSKPNVGEDEVREKTEYLKDLGFAGCYDKLKVFGDPPHKAKAKYCKRKNVALLFDNSVQNAALTSKYSTVLVPWSTMTD